MAQIKLLMGLNSKLSDVPVKEGQLLFTTDNHEIHLDTATGRVLLYDGLGGRIGALETLVGSTKVADQITNALKDAGLIEEGEDGKDVVIKAVSSVTAGNDSISIGGTAEEPTIAVKLSPKSDNALGLRADEGEEGLYVAPAAAPEYTIVKAETAETGFASTYKLMKDGVQAGASINIAKDKFLQSVALVDEDGDGNEGKFIKMVFEDDTSSTIYLDVKTLIDVYKSGSNAGDMVVIAVDPDTNKITATITDGTITKAKLDTEVQDSLDLADSAVQPEQLDLAADEGKYVAGIKVDATTKAITLIQKNLDMDGLNWGTFDDAAANS